jgi:hypothetical protein
MCWLTKIAPWVTATFSADRPEGSGHPPGIEIWQKERDLEVTTQKSST